MKALLSGISAALALWLACGFYIVRGNEQALVRRFGKARFPLAASGLHYDLPWPLARIDRVNTTLVRTVAIGVVPPEPSDTSAFLREVNLGRQGEFLTGDKNFVNVQVSVHYRVDDPYAFLSGTKSPEAALAVLAESQLADCIARSGIDFVHPLGLHEIRQIVLRGLQDALAEMPLGVAVEDLTIGGVYPPVEVKAAFLDVSNARAAREQVINQEHSREEKLLAQTQASAQALVDRAMAFSATRLAGARGAADRFGAIAMSLKREADSTGEPRDEIRRRAMQRMFLASLEEILPRLVRQVVLDPGRPVDLTIFATEPPAEKRPASRDDQ